MPPRIYIISIRKTSLNETRTMNKHQSNKYPSLLIECACGCGRKFKPKYEWHRYFETRCRVKAWVKRQAEKEELIAVKERIEKIEQQLGIK